MLKKITIAPFFILSFAFFSFQLSLILHLPNLVFSLDYNLFLQTVLLVILAVIASTFFITYTALSQDIKFVLPLAALGVLIFIFFLPSPVNYYLSLPLLAFFLLSILFLKNALKTYINFRPGFLFTPEVKRLTLMFLLLSSFAYYLTIDAQIKQKGVEIPDSLIDTALKFTPQPEGVQKDFGNIPEIPAEELNLLKKNPKLLSQYGLDPSMLDLLEDKSTDKDLAKSNPVQLSVKPLIKQQVQELLKPYLNIIAPFLAVIFFFSLSFIFSITGVLISPLIWLIFYILEKTKVITFTKEMREVRKMVI